MFSEILRIFPHLDPAALSDMERRLGSRFTKTAKMFGTGIKAAIHGMIAGAGAALLEKILNPLKETQEVINSALEKGSDLAIRAKQFGSTSGEMARLQAVAQAKGVDQSTLNLLLEKFQSSIAQAVADPTKQSAVRNFVGEKDQVKAFFEFVQSLQKMTAVQQSLVEQDVFGERQINRVAEFLQAKFPELIQELKLPSAARLTKGIGNLEDVKSAQNVLEARRGVEDLLNKSGVINKSQSIVVDESVRKQQAVEDDRIKRFTQLQKASDDVEAIKNNMEKLLTEIVTSFPVIFTALNGAVDLLKQSVQGWKDIFALLKEFSKAPIFRGIRGMFGGGKGN